jgi:hypothetical protein
MMHFLKHVLFTKQHITAYIALSSVFLEKSERSKYKTEVRKLFAGWGEQEGTASPSLPDT